MGRRAHQHRLIVANDNGPSAKTVRIDFRDVDEQVMRTAAEVFLPLLQGDVVAANDN
jgi:hypothetical protein